MTDPRFGDSAGLANWAEKVEEQAKQKRDIPGLRKQPGYFFSL